MIWIKNSPVNMKIWIRNSPFNNENMPIPLSYFKYLIILFFFLAFSFFFLLFLFSYLHFPPSSFFPYSPTFIFFLLPSFLILLPSFSSFFLLFLFITNASTILYTSSYGNIIVLFNFSYLTPLASPLLSHHLSPGPSWDQKSNNLPKFLTSLRPTPTPHPPPVPFMNHDWLDHQLSL